jgi:hypothetical protein
MEILLGVATDLLRAPFHQLNRFRGHTENQGFLTSVAGAAWMPRSMWTGNL